MSLIGRPRWAKIVRRLARSSGNSRLVVPLVNEFWVDGHSAEAKEGELDLGQFATFTKVRTRPQVWQDVVRMLESGEMPPEDSNQLSPEEKDQLQGWAQRYLNAELEQCR